MVRGSCLCGRTSGRELVRVFELPVRDQPPAYSRIFCARCGCIIPDPDPDPEPQTELFEIAVGLLDDDPALRSAATCW